MTTTRRSFLAAAGAALALLAGCAGRNRQPSTESPTQVPTTDGGVAVGVRNDTDETREVRVAGVDGDGQSVSLAPGESLDAGVLEAPESGEISYLVVVWVDGERADDRRVAVTPDTDLAAVVAHLQDGSAGGYVSWSEMYRGSGSASEE